MKKKYLGLLALSPMLILGLSGSSENTSEPPSNETPIVEVAQEESETESVKDEIRKFKDTYIIPIFSTVFGTVSVGTIISIFFAFKNRKTNKLMKEENDKIIAFVKDFYKTAESIVLEVVEMKKVCEEQAELFKGKSEELVAEVEGLKEAADKVVAVKKILITLGEIQTELVRLDPNAVTSGVSKSLRMLNEQIKSLE